MDSAESKNRELRSVSNYESATKESLSSFSHKSPAAFPSMSNPMQNELLKAVAHAIEIEISNKMRSKCYFVCEFATCMQICSEYGELAVYMGVGMCMGVVGM